MSNIVQRILNNAVLFALLMSVSLTLHASNADVNLDNAKISNHFITCDIPDQANLDFDVDTHVNTTAFLVYQSYLKEVHSFYTSTTFNRPFSTAYQRGPPSF